MVSDAVANVVMPLVQAAVAATIVVWGWSAVHKRSVERDLANKRRDLKVQYLIDAYRRLQGAGHRPLVPPYSSDLESAIADVQLFGDPAQVAAAQKFAFEMADHGQALLDDLLASLRNDLRNELQLERTEGKLTHLRIGDKREGGNPR
jgi:hypothetical protein